MLFAVFTVIKHFQIPAPTDPADAILIAGWSIDTFTAIPTLCFSFVCHTTLLPVYVCARRASHIHMYSPPITHLPMHTHHIALHTNTHTLHCIQHANSLTSQHPLHPHPTPHRTRVVIVSYAELKAADALGRSRRGNLSIQRMSTISRSSVGLSAIIYIVGALFGYLTFRSGIDKDLLVS